MIFIDDEALHGTPSPYVAPYLSRKQAQALWEMLAGRPEKKWRPLLAKMEQALNTNAAGRVYRSKS